MHFPSEYFFIYISPEKLAVYLPSARATHEGNKSRMICFLTIVETTWDPRTLETTKLE